MQHALSRSVWPSILIVEDNPIHRSLALKSLEVLGYASEAVSNGQEAIERMTQSSYKVILMDCRMPELDGYAATQKLREQAINCDSAIIGLTACAVKGDREKCLRAGMDDYLSKPFRLVDLDALLKKWLG
ncbi:MAG: response regulator [Elainellaceae cyanobacterium]